MEFKTFPEFVKKVALIQKIKYCEPFCRVNKVSIAEKNSSKKDDFKFFGFFIKSGVDSDIKQDREM